MNTYILYLNQMKKKKSRYDIWWHNLSFEFSFCTLILTNQNTVFNISGKSLDPSIIPAHCVPNEIALVGFRKIYPTVMCACIPYLNKYI